MIKSRVWSEERISEMENLMSDKKIMFITLDSKGKGRLSSDEEYDIILGYNSDYELYFACKARYHTEHSNISLNKSKPIGRINTREIKVCYKQIAAKDTFERVVIIPTSRINEFCSKPDYYLDTYQQDAKYQDRLEVI